MIAKHEATPKFDARTEAALAAGEAACTLVAQLLDGSDALLADRQEKAKKIVEAIELLRLDDARNAADAARSRQLLQKAVGLDVRRKEPPRTLSEQRRQEEAYVQSLGGDWPAVVEAVRNYGVRFWGTCIYEAEQAGCDAAHVLQLLTICKTNEGKFKDAKGELCNRIRQAYKGLDPYEGWRSNEPIPRPKPPTFEELLLLEFGEEMKEKKARGEPADEDLMRRWTAFHRRHKEASDAWIHERLHGYSRRLDEARIQGQERSDLIDQFWNTCGLVAPDAAYLKRKATA